MYPDNNKAIHSLKIPLPYIKLTQELSLRTINLKLAHHTGNKQVAHLRPEKPQGGGGGGWGGGGGGGVGGGGKGVGVGVGGEGWGGWGWGLGGWGGNC